MTPLTFRDRAHAARSLVDRLAEYRGQRPLVLAIPRGAVPMAAIIADALGGEVDVVLVRKLGAPGQPELAIGAVDEMGRVSLVHTARDLGISEAYIAREVEAQLKVIRARRSLYTPVHPPIDPAGRVAIVVDDGIATGATMLSALAAVRERKPATLVAAIGVAPADVVWRVQDLSDRVVCLVTPEVMFAVGEFYRDFPSVSDEEVVDILSKHRAPAADSHP
ncbi:MAG: phosphoribosyltransferase family protein [Nitrospirota bacterium]